MPPGTKAPNRLQPESILRLEDGALVLLDQTRLPAEAIENRYTSWPEIADAIRGMVVRGAPAIGIAAAYGVAVAAAGGRGEVERACQGLEQARPTAVNLAWAIEQMRRAAAGADDRSLQAALEQRAGELHRQEVDRCVAIGEHGAPLLRSGGRVLTHCNAGALATGGYGTALGVIRTAHRRGSGLHVWVDETRPLLQGARLTAWELEQDGIPATLITDSMAGWLMAQQRVDAVITGADRIAANGDAANKIGTYALSVLARAHGIPFYVAAPTSTIDPNLPDGAAIPIEHRAPSEVQGTAALQSIGVYNPAFDVTPAANITAIVTEDGVHRPPYRFG
ncbi:MAG: S-methyl-5-thioribose-1-phosphate isomerase [Gaiellales bacterium]